MVKEGIEGNYDEIDIETFNKEENYQLHIFYETVINITERILCIKK